MRIIIRKASVQWRGGLKGRQSVTTESGALKNKRCVPCIPLGSGSATNPAELIAAAHAGSFSMALSNELGLMGFSRGEIATTAAVKLENLSDGWSILKIHLNVLARLPKLTQCQFIDATVRAKTCCVVSRLLRANISMTAKLEK